MNHCIREYYLVSGQSLIERSMTIDIQSGIVGSITQATQESSLAYFVLGFNGLIIITAIYFIAKLLHQEFEVFSGE